MQGILLDNIYRQINQSHILSTSLSFHGVLCLKAIIFQPNYSVLFPELQNWIRHNMYF